MVRQTAESPAGDPEKLILYAEAAQRLGYPTIAPWFSAVHAERAHLAARRDAMAAEFLRGLTLCAKDLSRSRDSPNPRSVTYGNPRGPDRLRPLLRAMLYLLRNQSFEPDINDARDICIA